MRIKVPAEIIAELDKILKQFIYHLNQKSDKKP